MSLTLAAVVMTLSGVPRSSQLVSVPRWTVLNPTANSPAVSARQR